MDWIGTHIEITVTVAATLLAAVWMLQQRRTPQSAAAWLLAFVAIPYVALPAFLLLGIRKEGAGAPRLDFGAPTPPAPALCGKAPAPPLATTLRALGAPAAEPGNSIAIQSGAREGWDALAGTIASAREGIDATFYLVSNDDVGRRFVEMLTARAREGVRVRLIIDRLGGFLRPRAALRELTEAGGELRYFSPLLQRPGRGHLNLRNHRKMLIADRARVFAGGRNVGRDYLDPGGNPGAWHDLSYVAEGPVVRAHAEVFASDWAAAGPRGPAASGDVAQAEMGPVHDAPEGGALAQLVPSGPDMRRDAFHDALVQAIHAARARVWVATPYFLPTEALEGALRVAARRGLDVRVLVPARSNHPVTDVARGAYLRSLAVAGARVMQLEGRMMHAKAGVVDDAAWLGSPNLDVRSMLLNFESALFLYDAPSVERIAAWFEALAEGAPEGVAPAGRGRQVMEGLMRLGAPVL